MIEFDIDHIASGLTEDGDEYVVTRAVSDLLPPEVQAEAGTWTFRLRIEPDEYLSPSDMTDPEVFGRFEAREYGRDDRDRPDGFTGAAVKIRSDSDQSTYFWYEPPKDFRKFKGSGFTTIEDWERAKAFNLRYVRSVLSWGYIIIGIEATHRRPDGYTRSWFSSVGGVENPIDSYGPERNDWDAHIAELVHDQLLEVSHQINQETEQPCSQPS